MTEIPATSGAQLMFALNVLGEHTKGDSLTPLTVRVAVPSGSAFHSDDAVHYAVTSVEYDEERDEYVLSIDQSAPAPGACGYTHSHTQQWCSNPRCRRA